MPKWIHDRADHIRSKNPDMSESQSFAIATQQAHKLGKTPKGYGTKSGKREAMAKYDRPKKEYKKTAAAPPTDRTRENLIAAYNAFKEDQKLEQPPVVGASSALFMHGLHPTYDDIDVYAPGMKAKSIKTPYKGIEVDAHNTWFEPEHEQDLRDNAQDVDGVRTMSPKQLLRMYEKLDRPKDQDKLKMLRQHVLEKKAAFKIPQPKPSTGMLSPMQRLRRSQGVGLQKQFSQKSDGMRLQKFKPMSMSSAQNSSKVAFQVSQYSGPLGSLRTMARNPGGIPSNPGAIHKVAGPPEPKEKKASLAGAAVEAMNMLGALSPTGWRP